MTAHTPAPTARGVAGRHADGLPDRPRSSGPLARCSRLRAGTGIHGKEHQHGRRTRSGGRDAGGSLERHTGSAGRGRGVPLRGRDPGAGGAQRRLRLPGRRRLARRRRWGAAPATSTAATPTPPCAPSRRRCGCWKAREAATSFATGMAAISNTLFTLLSPGDRVVSVKDTYGGTNKLFMDFLPRIGITADLCDTDRPRRRSRPPSRAAAACSTWSRPPTRRSRSSTSRGWPRPPTRRRRGRRRQHLRHADQPEPAGSGRRPGGPQRHQVPRRSRRRAGRRGVRRSRSWSPRSTTIARSPARRSTRWRPTCCCAG